MINYILEDTQDEDNEDEIDSEKFQERANYLDSIMDMDFDDVDDANSINDDDTDKSVITKIDTPSETPEEINDEDEDDDDEFTDEITFTDEDEDGSEGSKEIAPQKPRKRRAETQRSIKPLFIKLDKSDNKPIHSDKIRRLNELLENYGVDINNYNPTSVDWSEWEDKDIKEYNTLISAIKFQSVDWSSTASLKDVDPYAMSQVDFDLWPDISVTIVENGKKIETTLKSALAKLLFGAKIDPQTNKPEVDKDGNIVGNVNEWANAERNTEEYENLKRIYAASREYYRNNVDKTSQLRNLDFLNQYSELNSETPLGVKSGMIVGLWRLKGTDVYVPIAMDETERLQKEARKRGQKNITITRKVVENGETTTKTFTLVPVLSDPAGIKARLSFAPRSGRRVYDNQGWSKAQKVGGLNNAIANLFSGSPFINNDQDRIDWATVAELEQPIDEYIRLTRENRGNYLLGWEDYALLKLVRMFTSVLPSTKRFDDLNNDLRRRLKTATTPEEKLKIEDQINKNQEKIDRPSSPNREEWDKNFAAGVEYPARILSPSNQLEFALDNIDDVYLYINNGDIVESPLKNEEGFGNYKYIGPAKNIIKQGVASKIKEIKNIIDLTKKETKKEIKKENLEQDFVEEGFITSPATIIINGNPFKLRYGDKLIMDNAKI